MCPQYEISQIAQPNDFYTAIQDLTIITNFNVTF